MEKKLNQAISEGLREGNLDNASSAFASGKDAFRKTMFGDAEASFAAAEAFYGAAGDDRNAAIARRHKLLSRCKTYLSDDLLAGAAHERDVKTFRLLLGEGEEDDFDRQLIFEDSGPLSTGIKIDRSRLGACLQFPPEAAAARAKLASLEQQERDKQQLAEPNTRPNSQQSRPQASIPQQTQVARPPAPAAMFQPSNAVSCGSDITGTGGPLANTQTCLNQAQYTLQQPYNHSVTPLQFHQFNGRDILIRLGETLWSLPDSSSPTGRQLVAMPWDKVSTVPENPRLKGCREQGTSATTEKFLVRIDCEIERQAALERQFEHRDDLCIPQYKCKGPVRFDPGWRQRPLSYWKAHPDEVTGACSISNDPHDNGRSELERCVREENWHSASECSDYGIASTINSRGLLGCYYNEGTTVAPAAPQAAGHSDPDAAAIWLIIAGSWPADDPDTNAKAKARKSFLSTQKIQARIVNTNDYPNLTPNLIAVVLGPFNRENAEVQFLIVQNAVADAFIKRGL